MVGDGDGDGPNPARAYRRGSGSVISEPRIEAATVAGSAGQMTLRVWEDLQNPPSPEHRALRTIRFDWSRKMTVAVSDIGTRFGEPSRLVMISPVIDRSGAADVEALALSFRANRSTPGAATELTERVVGHVLRRLKARYGYVELWERNRN